MTFKSEKILSWIGISLSLVNVILLMIILLQPDLMKAAYVEEFSKDPNFTMADTMYVLELTQIFIKVFAGISFIFIVLAIIATLMMNKTKASGVILIIVGVLKLIITFGTGIFSCVLWIIAGIKRVRYKPQLDVDLPIDDSSINNLKDPYEYR